MVKNSMVYPLVWGRCSQIRESAIHVLFRSSIFNILDQSFIGYQISNGIVCRSWLCRILSFAQKKFPHAATCFSSRRGFISLQWLFHSPPYYWSPDISFLHVISVVCLFSAKRKKPGTQSEFLS